MQRLPAPSTPHARNPSAAKMMDPTLSPRVRHEVRRTPLCCTSFHGFRDGAIFYPSFYPNRRHSGVRMLSPGHGRELKYRARACHQPSKLVMRVRFPSPAPRSPSSLLTFISLFAWLRSARGPAGTCPGCVDRRTGTEVSSLLRRRHAVHSSPAHPSCHICTAA